ncbi:Wzz/FepE/Etk N-terminal domain-containing protein [Geobacter sp. AOG1]|uniref:GumC family protein n=1 Tax=Geobacter sp. AOG1 TaxID=1566346 RepID=UPI001CC6F3DF|nr:Wzz/FepE/Etk N-terminal domain-containing protein [Geobacter sp. AOG1]GFE58596.1 polysaccharide chain length determinant protein [Geobacter sp. AOG1]
MPEEEAVQQPNVTILDYLIVLLKWKRLIVWTTVAAVVLSAIVSLLIPKIYKAEARILPPQQASGGAASQLLNQLGGLGVSPGLVGMKTTNDLYIGLLKSRTVLDRMVDRFNLLVVYNVKYREDARREFSKALKIKDDKKSSIIALGVEDRDPKRSADMTNALIEELKDVTQNIALTEASQRRLFFEEQLKNVKTALTRSEESLKGYQEQTGVIEIKEQAKALIDSIARLHAQIAAKEVELKVLKTHATQRNPDRQQVEEELRGLQEQLAKLQSKKGSNSDTLVPTGKMPEAGAGSLRKIRDVKYNETLYELLAKQYEIAKIDEARDAAIIQVLDKALPPEKKVKPNRLNLIATTAFMSFFLAILAAFFMEYRNKTINDPGNREKLDLLKNYV